MTDYPPAVADRLAKLNAALAECAALRAHAEGELDRIGHQEELAKVAHDVLLETAAAFCDAQEQRAPEWYTPSAVPPGTQEAVAPDHSPERKRRDIRGEVLALLEAETGKPLTADMIAERLDTLKAGVERALDYHSSHGRIFAAASGGWTSIPPAFGDDSEARHPPPAPIGIQSAAVPQPQKAQPTAEAVESVRRTGKNRDETVEALCKAGSMGLGPAQCAVMAISNEVLDELISTGEVEAGEDNRVRLVTLPEPFNPLADLNNARGNSQEENYAGADE